MTFDDVLQDLEKLVGYELHSIKPGAEIKIQQVNKYHNRIVLLTTQGVQRTRPINELKAIWQELCQKPAVHVDEVLHGSGTSRNQPETILANLPYIEWFKYNQKKHIAFVEKNTHVPGSLKKMDETKAEELREKLRKGTNPQTIVLVVASDIYKATKQYEMITGISVEPIKNGVYKAVNTGMTVIFLTMNTIVPAINEGIYFLFNKAGVLEEAVDIELSGIHCLMGSSSGMQIITPKISPNDFDLSGFF